MGLVQSKHQRQMVLIMLGGTSIFALIFAYILLLGKVRLKQKTIRYKSELMPILGLVNFGNSCYLNSVLQALAASMRYREWILQSTAFYGFQFPGMAIFNEAFQVINRDKKTIDEISQCKVPLDALRIIKYKCENKFKTAQEEDAHEFWQAVMRVISEEAMCIKKARLTGNLDSLQNGLNDLGSSDNGSSGSGSDSIDASPPILMPEGLVCNLPGGTGDSVKELKGAQTLPIKTRIGEIKGLTLEPENPFIGILSSQLQCVACLEKSKIKLDVFDHITLNLPPIPKPRVTLSDLIDSYFNTILVHSVDCSNCSLKYGHPTKSSFSQKFAITRLPPAFCFHIQRLTWTNYGLPIKRNDSVQFPDILNLSSIQRMHEILTNNPVPEEKQDREVKLNKLQNSIYSLRAVICHLGDSMSGHFITYRRASMPFEGASHEEGWFFTSDKIVRPVRFSEVLLALPYMLLYERPPK